MHHQPPCISRAKQVQASLFGSAYVDCDCTGQTKELHQLRSTGAVLCASGTPLSNTHACFHCTPVSTAQGTAVAVKRLLTLDTSTTERFISEVRILARLRHPNLILFMGYCTKPDLCIVSEYLNKGSLFSVLRQYEREGHTLEAKLQRVVAVSVARGMSYLHTRSPPILHLVSRTGRTSSARGDDLRWLGVETAGWGHGFL